MCNSSHNTILYIEHTHFSLYDNCKSWELSKPEKIALLIVKHTDNLHLKKLDTEKVKDPALSIATYGYSLKSSLLRVFKIFHKFFWGKKNPTQTTKNPNHS